MLALSRCRLAADLVLACSYSISHCMQPFLLTMFRGTVRAATYLSLS